MLPGCRGDPADYAYPVIGSLPVDVVETAHVMQFLQPIWSTKTETASRVRGRIEKVLTIAPRYRSCAPARTPARWTGHLDHLLPAKGKLHRLSIMRRCLTPTCRRS